MQRAKTEARAFRSGAIASSSRACSWLAAVILASFGPAGARAVPRIGFVLPAGGQAGTSFEVGVGGQELDAPIGLVLSGEGISAEVLDHFKLPAAEILDDYRDKSNELRELLRQDQRLPDDQFLAAARRYMAELNLTEKKLAELEEWDDRNRDPKRQINSLVGEVVSLRVEVAANATPGL